MPLHSANGLYNGDCIGILIIIKKQFTTLCVKFPLNIYLQKIFDKGTLLAQALYDKVFSKIQKKN